MKNKKEKSPEPFTGFRLKTCNFLLTLECYNPVLT